MDATKQHENSTEKHKSVSYQMLETFSEGEQIF